MIQDSNSRSLDQQSYMRATGLYGNVIECGAERDRDPCGCEGGPTLGVLKEVQKAYEERMEVINRVGGSKKLQMQVEVLQSWVSDLMGQNTLLAQTVEELETEITTRLLLERRKHAEIECELRSEVGTLRRQLARKDSDLRGLLEVLRRLRQFDYCTIDGIHFNEVTQSDIFGPVLWEHSNLNQGDTKSGEFKQEAGKGRKPYKF
ncbi:unnamed protein product, partial [Brenthis ino]